MASSTRVQPERVRILRGGEIAPGPVLYWLRREQRVRDNWALLYAQDLALAGGRPLGVVFCLVPSFLGAARRHFEFMLAGLRSVDDELATLQIAFFCLRGDPAREIPALAASCHAGCLVTDFNPLRISRQWEQAVCARVEIPVHLVDAHNVVPVWLASDKQEYAARTLRPKLRRQLPRFLSDLPAVRRHAYPWLPDIARPDWPLLARRLRAPVAGGALAWCRSGEAAARAALAHFLDERLAAYATARNDPTTAGQSDLSPYLHFGQLAPQRAAYAAAQRAGAAGSADAAAAAAVAAGRDAFLEELIVRRELSDNFCHYNHDYDRYEGLPAWGRRTLEDHLDDPRTHLYDLAAFEAAATHDSLWNAAQTELAVRGKLHGYLRMYWAKKILEWTRDPAEGLSIAIALNDRYSLDGRDPNGYAGCAWSIGGLHDRPWTERPVFGKIRFMNLAGCRRKFRVDRYIERVQRWTQEDSR